MTIYDLRIVANVFWLHIKQSAVNGFVVFTVLVQPILVAVLAIYMLRETQSFQAISVIVGSALSGLWSVTLFRGYDSIQFERWSGTLEYILSSPTPLATIVVAKTIANTTMSLASMLVSYPLASIILGYPLTIAHPLAFVISLILTALAMACLGMTIAPILALKIETSYWVNALEFPVYIAGGFLFPISLLPFWSRPLSYVLAPYWAARALQITSSESGSTSEILSCWGLLLAFSLLYCIISVWLFRVLLRRAKEQATVGLQ